MVTPFINHIIALIISQDNHIHAKAIAAVEIHFLPFCIFLSSDHDENTKNQQYSMYIKATNDNIPRIQFIKNCISLSVYHKGVEYSDLSGKWRIHFSFSFHSWSDIVLCVP